ncbi:hypothetical protein QBC46DRAFT_255648 [Diplogelasinospora grovesii]|uniref:Abscission/NoCut checkpoint regulator n=1 Tax=Diplogelasinospora grovesii TaxID=303347 RepID=A0AAN6NBK0_9PEZI|nr:hypothetical protein QBC46DRAFT_255648 [Diplogelasinospora grovesii]
MARSSRPSDKTLLDRLNALKPTSVSLDKDTSVSGVGLDFESSQAPKSREDALADRLRTLRNRFTTQPDKVADKGTTPPAQPPLEWHASSQSESRKAYQIPPWAPGATGDDIDDGVADDDPDLDEFLDGLDFDPSHLEEEASNHGDDESKLAVLLESLRPPGSPNKATHHEGGADDEDNSDGEQMTKEVEDILSQMHDLNLAEQTTDQSHDYHPFDEKGGLNLPGVPSGLQDPAEEFYKQEPAEDVENYYKTHPTGHEKEDPDQKRFEDEIAIRMASLKGLGSGGMNLDSFGLPSAPTFQPDDNLRLTPKKEKAGYTDEDQKTWCIVCLEDAAIKCIGCEGDVYCGRCWKDMHVGPRAGYDDRGHKWVKFERP